MILLHGPLLNRYANALWYAPSKAILAKPLVFSDNYITARRVTVPTFELYSNPTIQISSVKQRRFNIMDRATQKARNDIMAQEDANIFGAIDKLL